jgi:glycosyltransferase involved in cell wall biosynthesis
VSNSIALSAPTLSGDLSVSNLFLQEILPYMRQALNVDLYSEEPLENTGAFPIHTLFENDERSRYAASIVFLEDRPSGIFYRYAATSLPAVTVLCDANFERLFEASPFRFRDPKETPLLKQMVEKSAAVVTTNLHSLSTLRGFYPEGMPIPWSSTVVPCSVRSEREEELISARTSDSSTRIGYAGRYLTEDRACAVIESIIAIEEEYPIRLLWLSRADDRKYLQSFLQTEGERRGRDLSEIIELRVVDNFTEEREALCSCNIFLSLKSDLLRSPPSSFYHALALGIPTITLQIGPASEIPAECHLQIPPGKGEAQALHTALVSLVANPEVREQLSRSSRDYMALVHNPRMVAEDFLSLLRSQSKEIEARMNESREAFRILEASL